MIQVDYIRSSWTSQKTTTSSNFWALSPGIVSKKKPWPVNSSIRGIIQSLLQEGWDFSIYLAGDMRRYIYLSHSLSIKMVTLKKGE